VPRRARQNKSPNHKKKLHAVKAGQLPEAGVLEPYFPLMSTVQNKIYPFIQTTATPVTITSSVVGTAFGTVNFILNLIDQYTTFTALFDQYRIRMVETCFRPRATQALTTSASNPGTLCTVVDNDDSNALTTFAQAQDYENAITGTGLQSQTRTQVPHAAMAAYSGAFSSFANVASPWIDCTSPGVVHYGIKTAWTQTDVAYTIDITNRYWFEFRNVR